MSAPGVPVVTGPENSSVAENLDVNIFCVTMRCPHSVRGLHRLHEQVTFPYPTPERPVQRHCCPLARTSNIGSLFLLDSLPLCPDVFSVGPAVLCCL